MHEDYHSLHQYHNNDENMLKPIIIYYLRASVLYGQSGEIITRVIELIHNLITE